MTPLIDLNKLRYDVVAVAADATQLNLTDITSGLGWSEGEKELSAKITLKVANAEYNGKHISDFVQPFTPIFVYADMGAGSEEMIRGTVQKWELTETNREVYLNLEAADEVQAL